MSGCLRHLLLSFQFDQVFHDSSCIHSSPLLPTFEQKTPFSKPITVFRIKCGIPWTCWEETDCGLYHPSAFPSAASTLSLQDPLGSLSAPEGACVFHVWDFCTKCFFLGTAHPPYPWGLDESTICSEGKWLSTPSSVQDLCPRSFLAITLPHFHLCRTRMS